MTKPATYIEAALRAAVTFVWGLTGSMTAAGLVHVAEWKAAAGAGLGAVLNLGHRTAQVWLGRHGGDEGAVEPGSLALGLVLGLVAAFLLLRR